MPDYKVSSKTTGNLIKSQNTNESGLGLQLVASVYKILGSIYPQHHRVGDGQGHFSEGSNLIIKHISLELLPVSFLSPQHKLGSSGKKEPQLRKCSQQFVL